MTYREFKKINDIAKIMTGIDVGRIKEVNIITETCKLTLNGMTSVVSIGQLVDSIVQDRVRAISNPSLLQRWSGFSK